MQCGPLCAQPWPLVGTHCYSLQLKKTPDLFSNGFSCCCPHISVCLMLVIHPCQLYKVAHFQGPSWAFSLQPLGVSSLIPNGSPILQFLGKLVDMTHAPPVFHSLFRSIANLRISKVGSLGNSGDLSDPSLLSLPVISDLKLAGTVISAGPPRSNVAVCFPRTHPPLPSGVSGQKTLTFLPFPPYFSPLMLYFLVSKGLSFLISRLKRPCPTSSSPPPQSDLYIPFPKARMAKENWKTKKGTHGEICFLEKDTFVSKN